MIARSAAALACRERAGGKREFAMSYPKRSCWIRILQGGRASRAQSMVEFALVFPLFLGLLLAVFDTARFMAVYAGISNGVRAGARMATIPSATDTQIRDTVGGAIILADASTVKSSVSISPSTRTAFSQVTVSTSYSFTFNPLFAKVFSGFNLNTVTIQQSATATVEGP
jgi:Flp pilus assembly protein TadG